MPPKPLKNLDGKRKYLCSVGGEDFYLRVITSSLELSRCAGEMKSSWKEMEEKPDLRYALGPIWRRSLAQLQESLDGEQKGQKVQSPLPKLDDEGKRQKTEGFFQEMVKNFDQDEGAVIFVVENEAGEVASAMKTYILPKKLENSPKRENMQVDPSVGTLVLLSDVGTVKKYEGHGLFSAGFDKVLTMVNNPKRNFPGPFQFSVQMLAATSVSGADDTETKHVMNLQRYAGMWPKRFEDAQFQNRWQEVSADGKTTRDIGLDKMPIDAFLKDGVLDQEKIDRLIKDQEGLAKEKGKSVRGLFLVGDVATTYEENKAGRWLRAQDANRGGGKRTGEWEAAPSAAPQAASVVIKDPQKTL